MSSKLVKQHREKEKIMSSTTLYHITNDLSLKSIVADKLLRREGFNVEQMIKQITLGTIVPEQVMTPSGVDIRVLWRMKQHQYHYVGRYVWLTEEEDCQCISAQQDFEKSAFVFDASIIGAQRWVDVASCRARKSRKARMFIEQLNMVAASCGDDITKWWVVDKDIELNLCDNLIKLTTWEKILSANRAAGLVA